MKPKASARAIAEGFGNQRRRWLRLPSRSRRAAAAASIRSMPSPDRPWAKENRWCAIPPLLLAVAETAVTSFDGSKALTPIQQRYLVAITDSGVKVYDGRARTVLTALEGAGYITVDWHTDLNNTEGHPSSHRYTARPVAL